MPIHPKAILFDSDGVLVDSHHLVMKAWKQLSVEFELDFEKLQTEVVGVRAVETLTRYLTGDAVNQALARIDEIEIETASQTKPINGAVELLSTLPNTSWAIVTSASRDLGLARWSGANIALPPVIVTADDVTNGKPNPEPFIVGAKKCGVAPQDCVVFEDSPAGAAAATAAGATVVAVGNQEWDIEPFARVNDLSEVTVTTNSEGMTVDFR